MADHCFKTCNLEKYFLNKASLDRSTVDFEFLAKQFKITEWIIKNVAVSSAFLAKESGAGKVMVHIVKGLKRDLANSVSRSSDNDEPVRSDISTASSPSNSKKALI